MHQMVSMTLNKSIILVQLIIYFFFCASTSATDTLNQGDLFNSSSTPLLSRNGNFALGFTGGYLIINYTNADYNSHPVWTANRNNSILDNSGVLTIDESGKLKIMHSGGNPIELYKGPSSASSNKITAVLQDNGNFVLKQQEANSGEQQILWESFDHPTDALLPGMKLGFNRRTQKKWMLTSWLAASNPSPGAFTMEWDSSERQLIVKRRGIRFWNSGVLSQDNTFKNIPVADSSNWNYKYDSVSNPDEDYFTYQLFADQFTSESHKKFSMWFLDYTGNIKEPDFTRPLILNYEACDGNSTENGCERWEGPQCRRDGDKFRVRIGKFSPEFQKTIDNESMSFVDCKEFCWNNCECTAFRDTLNSTGCTYFVGPLDDQALRGGELSYEVIIPGPPSEADKTWIWVVTAAIVLIAILGSIFLYLRWRRLRLEEKFLKELMTSDQGNDASELENGENRGHNLQVFSVASIMSATNSFSPENKLGEGGFGPVYKGKLVKGQEIAVKRLSRRSGQGLVEFKNELILIAKLQHMNLVRLLGLCIQGEERLLVYEYMPNKSLDSFIFDQSKRKLLNWNKRFDIIEGIAQGLLYLHKYSRLRIIHRDLKASNILLDKDMNPKISDFGMARIFKANESEANTSRIVGTYGYMSPEYAMEGNFSEKSDVYSFGVLILEIISGKKNCHIIHNDRVLNLLSYAWELWREGNALELVDPMIKDSAPRDQVLRSINVALVCVEHNASDRPTMPAVSSMLTGDVQHMPSPKLPAFYVGRSTEKTTTVQEKYSANGLSFTDMKGR